jgi:hypothetical protein
MRSTTTALAASTDGGGWTVGADPCQDLGLASKSKQPKAKVFPHLEA